MKGRLVLRYILGHPIRSLLTLGSLTLAVFLICALNALVDALDTTIEGAAKNRLVVQSAVSLYVDLPLSYQGKIESVPGVETTCKMQWFGGIYREERNFFAQFACDGERVLDLYREMRLEQGTEQEFLAKRNGCLIGTGLAERFEWGLDSKIPLIGTFFPRTDGSPWEFEVAAIYDSDDPAFDKNTMFFHWDYFEEAIETGAVDADLGVGVYAMRVSPDRDVTAVMSDVDALFENGPQRVQTTTEAEFNRQFVSMLGNVPGFLGAIGGVVLIAVLLAAVNTMLLAGRERTRDLGIMKALGFSNGTAFTLLLLEAFALCGLGGLMGVGLVKAMEPAFIGFFSATGMVTGYSVNQPTVLLGLGAALGVGLVAGLLPAWNASRLRPVEALRSEA